MRLLLLMIVVERKPSSKPFEMALNKLQLKPEDSLMIGDWPERDVVGANK